MTVPNVELELTLSRAAFFQKGIDKYLYVLSIFETGFVATAVKQLDVILKKVSKHQSKCYSERKLE